MDRNQNLNDQLYAIVEQGNVYNELDTRLKSLSNADDVLEFFYTRNNQHLNLLMLAALSGHDEVMRILLSYSSHVKKLVELTGVIMGNDGNRVLNATALWCACDRGHYKVASVLIEVGHASVYHGLRNPLLIDAVIDNRLDIIQFLIENGYADMNRTRRKDHPRHNCLMVASTLNRTKIAAYLIGKGVQIDYKIRTNCETVLGCAATRGHFDMVKLLCESGISINTKNSLEETPLILAFKNGHFHIVDYLLNQSDDKQSIDEFELIASSYVLPTTSSIDPQIKSDKMVDFIQRSFKMRRERNLHKTARPPIAAYHFQKECETIEEFEHIRNDNDRLYVEALLIRERILEPQKTATLCEPLLIRGEYLIQKGDFETCLYLWEHVFHLYQNMGHETSLHRFVWVFCKMLTNKVPINLQLFLRICRLTFEPCEQNRSDHSLKNALCFVTLAARILQQQTMTKEERSSIYQWVKDLCRQQRTTTCGKTLLHLCVADQTYRDINYRSNEIKPVLNFPDLATTQLLLAQGKHWLNIDATDITKGNTALHIIAQSTATSALMIVKLLIDAGAHVDCLNKINVTPFNYARTTDIKLLLQKHQSPLQLKCHCARLIVKNQLNYEVIWNQTTKLNAFIYLHGRAQEQNIAN